ncbi:MAG TPA: tyrosine-type recombinase/integrase [Thermopolyspora sp.]|jgi:Site-specific recombinase XerD
MDDLITRHIRFLQGIRRAAATIEKREELLRRMDLDLPEGIAQASEDDIVGWLAQFDIPWTHYTYDGHARGAYRWWYARGMIEFDPMANIPKPKPGQAVPHPCSDDELAVALTARWPYGRAMSFASRLGLRCGEIAHADRRDVVGRRLRVAGKGGTVRMVPISDEDWAELIDPVPMPKGRGSAPLLGGEVTAAALTEGQRRVWRDLGLPDWYMDSGGHRVPGLSLHSGRHWFATRLLENGVDIRVVQVLLGHKSIRTTEGYTQVTDKRAAAAVLRLPRIEHAGARL